MTAWKAVFFDLDGTLADTLALIVRGFRFTMDAHHVEGVEEDAWLSTIGRPLRDQFREFVDDDDEIERMADTYATFQRTIHDDMVGAFPGARRTVDALKARGVRVAVVTSKRRRMAERTLACCGLGGAFEVVVCADDVTRGKPDPEPVRLAMARMGLEEEAAEILFVGDAPYDMEAGRAAGTCTAAVTWGGYPESVLRRTEPDHWVGSLEELLEL